MQTLLNNIAVSVYLQDLFVLVALFMPMCAIFFLREVTCIHSNHNSGFSNYIISLPCYDTCTKLLMTNTLSEMGGTIFLCCLGLVRLLIVCFGLILLSTHELMNYFGW